MWLLPSSDKQSLSTVQGQAPSTQQVKWTFPTNRKIFCPGLHTGWCWQLVLGLAISHHSHHHWYLADRITLTAARERNDHSNSIWSCHRCVFQPLPACMKSGNTSSLSGGIEYLHSLCRNQKFYNLSKCQALPNMLNSEQVSLHTDKCVCYYIQWTLGSILSYLTCSGSQSNLNIELIPSITLFYQAKAMKIPC